MCFCHQLDAKIYCPKPTNTANNKLGYTATTTCMRQITSSDRFGNQEMKANMMAEGTIEGDVSITQSAPSASATPSTLSNPGIPSIPCTPSQDSEYPKHSEYSEYSEYSKYCEYSKYSEYSEYSEHYNYDEYK